MGHPTLLHVLYPHSSEPALPPAWPTHVQLLARDLFAHVCHEGRSADTVLLLPEQYSFDPQSAAWGARCRLFQADFPEAITFGSWLPGGGTVH